MSKALIIGAVLATMVASTAQAQSFNPSAGSGNIVGPYSAPNSGPTMPAYNRSDKLAKGKISGSDAFAYAPARHHRHLR